jgi:hypothetical protein
MRDGNGKELRRVELVTSNPEKYLILDTETGDVWRPQHSKHAILQSFKRAGRIDVEEFLYKHQKFRG